MLITVSWRTKVNIHVHASDVVNVSIKKRKPLGIVAPPVKFVTSLYYSTVSAENKGTSQEFITELSNTIMTVNLVAYGELLKCILAIQKQPTNRPQVITNQTDHRWTLGTLEISKYKRESKAPMPKNCVI